MKNVNVTNIFKIVFVWVFFIWASISVESLFLGTEIFNIAPLLKFHIFVNGLWIFGCLFIAYMYITKLPDIIINSKMKI